MFDREMTMKRGMYFLLALGLAVVSIGCAKDAEKPKAPADSSAVTSAVSEEAPVTGEFTLVSLKVPNMT